MVRKYLELKKPKKLQTIQSARTGYQSSQIYLF